VRFLCSRNVFSCRRLSMHDLRTWIYLSLQCSHQCHHYETLPPRHVFKNSLFQFSDLVSLNFHDLLSQIGFYCPDEGMYGGYSCPVASFCPDFGMTSPQNCPKGYYCPTIQTTTPTICDAGFFCPSQSSSPLACGAMLTSQAGADGCHPTAGMYILIVVSALLVIGLVAWLWLRSSRPAQTSNGSALETASLIPEPEGPKYTGL
jgi:hypothetical protein